MAKNRRPRACRFRHFEFWAENGRVYLLDTEAASDSDADLDDQILTMSPGELMERAIAIRMVVADRDQPNCTLKQAKRLLSDAVVVAKAAKKQGDPTDPAVQEWMARNRRRSQILVPGVTGDTIGSTLLGIAPPPQYKIPKKDPFDIMRRGVQVTPDLSGGAVRTVTPQMAELMRKRRRR